MLHFISFLALCIITSQIVGSGWQYWAVMAVVIVSNLLGYLERDFEELKKIKVTRNENNDKN
jgi:hypothetical protein